MWYISLWYQTWHFSLPGWYQINTVTLVCAILLPPSQMHILLNPYVDNKGESLFAFSRVRDVSVSTKYIYTLQKMSINTLPDYRVHISSHCHVTCYNMVEDTEASLGTRVQRVTL